MQLLKGIKIIDFTRYFPGPYAALRLLDWGAQVVKIESPEGDPARALYPYHGAEGPVFRSVNRGKSAICANLKDDEGKRRVWEEIKDADIILEGFRPGVMARLGFSYEDAKAVNPGIVYCSLSGYGQTGPLSTISGHDINYMALSGCLDQLIDSAGRPIKPWIAIADLVGGLAASEAMLAGLAHRALTGEGCYCDISLAESALSLLGLQMTNYSLTGETRGCMDTSISYGVYETKDGRFVTIGAMEDKFWTAFCNAAGCPDLIPEKDSPADIENPAFRRMCEVIKAKDFAYWLNFFKENDCCFAPVLSMAEVSEFEGFWQRGIFQEKWGATYVGTHYLNGDPFLCSQEPYPALER